MDSITLSGTDGAKATLTASTDTLEIAFETPGLATAGQAVYVALDLEPGNGSFILPFASGFEGSTVFLPFAADRLLMVKTSPEGPERHLRRWQRTMWSERMGAGREFTAEVSGNHCFIRLSRAALGMGEKVSLTIYAKNLRQNNGWGRLFGVMGDSTAGGTGDQTIATGIELELSTQPPVARVITRFDSSERVRIYQLFVRLFGNTNETRKPNGTLAENGAGRFADINDAALQSLRQMHFTHLWLTGVLRQATATDYSSIGLPPDDPDLLKGLAGSPYAVRDYYDVSPDYAVVPANRVAEFKSLLERMHAHGLKAIIDFVPNHVARSYHSDIRPDDDFGSGDDRTKFFEPGNNFFYLRGPGPLRLPTCRDGVAISPTCKVLEGQCDGLFEPETEFGRVTGNNVNSWTPGLWDWYETVKLNYGYDFSRPDVREYPHGEQADKPVPDTWQKMDRVIEYWQAMGVDGFRCDMSHMVPPEYWRWQIGRARARDAGVFFMAEAYNNDPAKVAGGDPLMRSLNNVMFDLLNAGFSAVYDHPSYQQVKEIYDGGAWANDIDRVRTGDFIFGNSLRYAENHDEVRLAGQKWGKIGMEVGRPATAILFALGTGPLMIYSGQEVGEPAAGAEGFGGDDSRSSLFDYWSMPALVPWVNEHLYDGAGLSDAQKSLRDFYGRLLGVVNEPAFRRGTFRGLNAANEGEQGFGRLPGELASGHWLYACLRHDQGSKQTFLVVVNLHPEKTFEKVRVRLPEEMAKFAQLGETNTWIERLGGEERTAASDAGGVTVGDLPPLTPLYFELQRDPACSKS